MGKPLSEKKVLKALKIKDFSELAPEGVGKFVSVFADMDPEVAKKALEQIPDLASATKEMVSQYKEIVNKGLDSGDASVKPFYEACKQILDSLDRELQKDNLTQAERDHIIEQMMDVAMMMDEKDQKHKEFVKDVLKTGAQVVVVAGVVLASLIGGKDVNLPGPK